jgi:hypothetical protein
LFALDRQVPFGERFNALARFRGGSWNVTRWITHYIPPRLAAFALGRWQARPAEVLSSATPYLLCLTRDALREGLRILVAEWTEFRRANPGVELALVIRARLSDPRQSVFDFVSQYWDQVQALKRQLGVPRSGIYLWLRDRDDDGDVRLLDRARALVVAARAAWLTDPAGMALSRNKPLVASRDRDLPDDYPFAFATRPAVLRFLGEVRSPGTSSVPWPIPDAMALAAAISRVAAADDKMLAEAVRQLSRRQWCDRPEVVRHSGATTDATIFAPRPAVVGEGSGMRSSWKCPITPRWGDVS